MFRLPGHSRTLYGLCRSFINQASKRQQSSSTNGSAAAAKVAIEPNASKMSIFSGHIKGAITNTLEFVRPENITPLPIYQVLDSDGAVKDKSHEPNVRNEILYSNTMKFV